MPEWKDIINYLIALIGVLVTGYFSFRIVKATKTTNEVAQATLELNREISEREKKREKQFNQLMRRQLISEILNVTEKAEKALADVDATNIYEKLNGIAPKKLSVEKELLAKYFSEQEVIIITNAWLTYEEYLEKHYRPTYFGDDINVLVQNAPTVLIAFNKVINILKNSTN